VVSSLEKLLSHTKYLVRVVHRELGKT